MSNEKNRVAPQLDDEEYRRLNDYRRQKGLGNSDANAARRAMLLGLKEWERRNDPSQSWLLNIGLAASMVAVTATSAHFWGGVDWLWAAGSIWIAATMLLAHIVQLGRRYGIGEIPVVRRFVGGTADA